MGTRSVHVALTRSQIGELSSLFQKYLNWVKACERITAIYGERAYKIVTVRDNYGYFNDENYTPAITELYVKDVEGKTLKPDPELPMSKKLLDDSGAAYRNVEDMQESLEEFLMDCHDALLPIVSATYLVDQPPLPFELYIRRRDLKAYQKSMVKEAAQKARDKAARLAENNDYEEDDDDDE